MECMWRLKVTSEYLRQAHARNKSRNMEKLGARVADAIYDFLDAHKFFASARRQIAVREREADEAWYALHG
jgi:hypothetical protein